MTSAVELLHLPEVERLSPVVIRILAGNPNKYTLQGTNTYLVGTGASRLLIDTGQGMPSWKSALRRTLDQEKATISTAVITHWHGDHTGGIGDLLELEPGVRVYKNQSRESDGDGGARVEDIKDGQRFVVEGAALTAVHTPGHTVDHMVLVLEGEDAMFTGDNVLGQGTAVFEDLGTYLESLGRMAGLFKGRAYPGHGPVLADGPGKIAEYIRHRAKREEQVVQTLRTENVRGDDGDDGDDGWTPMELVKVIYRDVPEALHVPAAGGVVQILNKLQQEGKVVVVDDAGDGGGSSGGRWRLV